MATAVLEANLTSTTEGLSPAPTQRIVIIEKDFALCRALQRLFSLEGYEVDVVADVPSGLHQLRQAVPAALVLDLGNAEPAKSDVCHEIARTAPDLPLIVLGANSDVSEKVHMLEAGADDYLAVPFSPRELVARVRALIRRATRPFRETLCAFEGVIVDFFSMEVTRYGEKVQLTNKEFKTLSYMVKNPNRVISRDELLNAVWEYYSYPCTRTVDNHILKLRQKLESNPSTPAHFLTAHGLGYKFVP
jgi:DNA-binding response OmpR family regulator